MQEEWPAPLHLFDNIRAGFMDQPAQMRQHRLRKRRRLRNISIDIRIQIWLVHESSLHKAKLQWHHESG